MEQRSEEASDGRASTDGNLGARGARAGPGHRRLEVFIGKWINEGEAAARPFGMIALRVCSQAEPCLREVLPEA